MQSLKITAIGYKNENPFRQILLMNRKMRNQYGIKEGDFLKVKKGTTTLYVPVAPQFKGTMINDVTLNFFGAALLGVQVNDVLEVLGKVNVALVNANISREISNLLEGGDNALGSPDDIINGEAPSSDDIE